MKGGKGETRGGERVAEEGGRGGIKKRCAAIKNVNFLVTSQIDSHILYQILY